jgi:type VI secretion system protein ImpJ
MSANNRVVWSEGLFLQPQHFQQQDRYFERYVETRCRALHGYGWGFTELGIERDFLGIGKFGLRAAAGVCPDGTPFSMPEDDPLPTPLEIGSDVRDQVVYLAVPVRRAGEADVDRGAGSASGDGLERQLLREVQSRDTT